MKEHDSTALRLRIAIVCVASCEPLLIGNQTFRACQIVHHAWISWWPAVALSRNQPPGPATDQLHSLPDVLQKEIGSRYSGNFLIGRDLDVN
jgi:hypothetical protein